LTDNTFDAIKWRHLFQLRFFVKFQNNNPKVFSKDARPIIEFSIENRKALNAREKRQQKSVEKNPTLKKKVDGNNVSNDDTKAETSNKAAHKSQKVKI
jgi:hypothetical protein